MITEKSLKEIFKFNICRWRTSITLIEKNCIITRGYLIEDLIENLSFPEVIFLLLMGDLPSKNKSKMLNAILVSFCDHGVTPPSTQVARLTRSTGSSLNASLAAGLLAFGENHAGAIEKAMKLFQETISICKSQKDIPVLAEKIVEEHLQMGKKIPGYGHRYHQKDPRATKILKIAKELKCTGPHTQLAKEIEKILYNSKKIHLNIDGANAAILSDIGFHWSTGTGIFMIGRLPGLIAHINEESQEEPFRKTLKLEEIQYHGKKPNKKMQNSKTPFNALSVISTQQSLK
ncbi:MAG: citryl-CoA lyase [Methanothermobacter sp.]|nr:citryl-CoA lyase [Methanothermobacter sp.]